MSDEQRTGVGLLTPSSASSAPEHQVQARVLVLLPEGAQAFSLVRWAVELAEASGGALWYTPLDQRTDGLPAAELRSACALAERLGGHALTVRPDLRFDNLLEGIAHEGITDVVVGKPHGVPLARFLAAALPPELVSGEGGPRLVVLAEPAGEARHAGSQGVK